MARSSNVACADNHKPTDAYVAAMTHPGVPTPPRDLPRHDDPFQPYLDRSFRDEEPPWQHWNEAAPFLAGTVPLLLAGVAALVLGTFLGQLWFVLDGGGEGLAQTASWFVWGGRVVVAVALVAAAVRTSPAGGALRLALVAVALLFLVGFGGALGAGWAGPDRL